MSLTDFEQIKELGKGAFGTVLLCKRLADEQKYAMKRVKISKLNVKDQTNALNEVRVLASLNHKNVIDYKEAFYDKQSSTLNIIMEYAEEGDIARRIKQCKTNKTYMSENDIWSLMIQMIQGLKALHDKKIMHRDLKSANVFLMKDGTVKIGDLNVSKVVKLGFLKTQTGTPFYTSPEVWSEKPYDYKSDIWSVGCIIYEMCSLRPPFRGQSLEQLYKSITRGVYEPIPSIYSKELHTIINLLLQLNPTKRPNCDSFMEHPLIQKKTDVINIETCTGFLLGTIKLPQRIDEINEILPKLKRYSENCNKTVLDFKLEKKTPPKSALVRRPSTKSIPPQTKKVISEKIKEIINPIKDNISSSKSISKDKILLCNKINIKKLSGDINFKVNLASLKHSKNLPCATAIIDLFKNSPNSKADKENHIKARDLGVIKL